MNILTASQKLVNYFLKYDSINDEQIFGLVPEKEDHQACCAAFTCALDEMEKNQIVVSKSEEIEIGRDEEEDEENKKTYVPSEKIKFTTWVLKRPLQNREQVLLIDGITALKVSAVVNNFYQMANNGQMIYNPIQITNNDILILLEVIALYAKQNMNKAQEETKVDKKKKE
jgi:hypothetical protein